MKYGKTPHNCMELHIHEIEKRGFCWFGKIGTPPSISIIREKVGVEPIKILLYCKDEIYICNCIEITNAKPKIGCPEYYNKYLFGRGTIPKIYFKLNSITKIEKSVLANCVILSSRNSMLDTVSRSMASFFYVEYADPKTSAEIQSVKEKKIAQRSKKNEEKKKLTIGTNDCLYRISKICTNKHCISYEYECTRPSCCEKQKLK